MANMDPQTVRQIWGRVQGEKNTGTKQGQFCQPEAAVQTLYPDLAEEALMLGGQYLRLAETQKGNTRQKLRQMASQCRHQSGVLRGLCRLHTGKKISTAPSVQKKVPAEQLCRQCLGMQQHLYQNYRQNCTHEQYGQIFQKFCDGQQEHYQMLLLLLGQLS